MVDIVWFSRNTLTELLLLSIAFLLSALIGLERQRKLKSAGLRTHTLVGVGSAVFTLVSAYGFEAVIGSEVVLDPSRIAAQIVSGVGFLGAGVIFVRKNVVSGLTTAASIWVTAAIGMACGAGMPSLALAATALHLVTVGVLTLLGRRVRPSVQDPALVVRYRLSAGALRAILTTSSNLGYEASLISTREFGKEGARRVEAVMRFSGDKAGLTNLIGQLSDLKGVMKVRMADDEGGD
ncbi:MgtC/SapB family protein [Microbacterium sp.]|uniref:MgtC/SapB family protein n=1 Tax=Microbacterium sp. TaxID=51671 RepID=UPI003F95F158